MVLMGSLLQYLYLLSIIYQFKGNKEITQSLDLIPKYEKEVGWEVQTATKDVSLTSFYHGKAEKLAGFWFPVRSFVKLCVPASSDNPISDEKEYTVHSDNRMWLPTVQDIGAQLSRISNSTSWRIPHRGSTLNRSNLNQVIIKMFVTFNAVLALQQKTQIFSSSGSRIIGPKSAQHLQ